MNDVTKAYRHHYQAVKSLKVVYEVTQAPLIDEEILWKHLQRYSYAPTTYTFVVQENKVYQRSVHDWRKLGDVIDLLKKEDPDRLKANENGLVDTSGISYSEIREKLPLIETETRDHWLMYDGSLLREKAPDDYLSGNVRIPVYFIHDPAGPRGPYLRPGYPHRILFAPRFLRLDKENELARKNRIPDLFCLAKFSVAERLEKVNQGDCVVVTAPGIHTLWLDPKRGFAVRRRFDAELSFTMECEDLVQVVPGVWMPKTITMTFLASADLKLPAEYHGKPYLRHTLRVKRIEVNDPKHAEYFRFKPVPGAMIMDTRTEKSVF